MGNCCNALGREFSTDRLFFDDFNNNGKWIKVFGSSSNMTCLNDSDHYEIFKIAQAVFMTAILIWSVLDGYVLDDRGCIDWPIYLTHWALIMQVLFTWTSALAVRTANAAESKGESGPAPCIVQMTWLLQNMLLPGTFLVFVLFWALVFPNTGADSLSYFVHGVNFIVMALDVMLSRIPYYLLHGFYFALFGLIYVLFTFVFHLADGVTCGGFPYVYAVLNWNEPMTAQTVTGVVLFVVAPILNFFFWFCVRCCRGRQAPAVADLEATRISKE